MEMNAEKVNKETTRQISPNANKQSAEETVSLPKSIGKHAH